MRRRLLAVGFGCFEPFFAGFVVDGALRCWVCGVRWHVGRVLVMGLIGKGKGATSHVKRRVGR